MNLVRTFHPVGHGAFYSEVLYDDKGEVIQTVVYDCGTLSKREYLYEQIDVLRQITDRIDALFISHFHTDHTSGIDYLSKKFDIERIFIPVLTDAILVESLMFNAINHSIYCVANRFISKCRGGKGKNHNIVKIMEFNMDDNDIESIPYDKIPPGTIKAPIILNPAYKGWQYIPYNIKNTSAEDLIKCLKNDNIFKTAFIGQDKVLIGKLKDLIKSNFVYCKQIYESVYKNSHNSYSMALYSGLGCNNCKECYNILDCHCRNCLYMGDFEASPNYPKQNFNCFHLKEFYKNYWDGIRLLQVPHHGSEHNLNADLYTPEKLCIMSVGVQDKFNHPDRITIDTIIAKQSIPIIVTEDSMTKQMFTYNLP